MIQSKFVPWFYIHTHSLPSLFHKRGKIWMLAFILCTVAEPGVLFWNRVGNWACKNQIVGILQFESLQDSWWHKNKHADKIPSATRLYLILHMYMLKNAVQGGMKRIVPHLKSRIPNSAIPIIICQSNKQNTLQEAKTA